MDRKLHVDTLILIPKLKIYIFWNSGQKDGRTDRRTDGWTDGRTETLIRGGWVATFLQVNRQLDWPVLGINRYLDWPESWYFGQYFEH